MSNNHLTPVVQQLAVAGTTQQLGQQLVQVLTSIAQTQQEILSLLQQQPQAPGAGQKVVPSYPASSDPVVQYNWLYAYGLAHNFDGTRKRQQITAKDVDEHQKMLATFGTVYNIFSKK